MSFDFDAMAGAIKEQQKKEERSGGIEHQVKPVFSNDGKTHVMKVYLLPPLHEDDSHFTFGHFYQEQYFVKPFESAHAFAKGIPTLALASTRENANESPISKLGFDLYRIFTDSESRERKAVKTYMANERKVVQMLIIEDTIRPELNGKIVSFELKQFIDTLIKRKMNPSEEDINMVKGNPYNWNEQGNLLYITVSIKDTVTATKDFKGRDWEYSKSTFVNNSDSLKSVIESGALADKGISTIDDLTTKSVRLMDYWIEPSDDDTLIQKCVEFERKNSTFKFWQEAYPNVLADNVQSSNPAPRVNPTPTNVTDFVNEVNDKPQVQEAETKTHNEPEINTPPVVNQASQSQQNQMENNAEDVDLDSLIDEIEDMV